MFLSNIQTDFNFWHAFITLTHHNLYILYYFKDIVLKSQH